MAKKRQPKAKPKSSKPHPKPAKPAAVKPQPSEATGLKSLAEIVQITGVPVGMISVAVRTGFLPAGVHGRYQVEPTLIGLVKFLHDRQAKLPIYDNPNQCAEMTGIPLSAIKAARKSGKVGQDGRIALAMLLRVLFGSKSENWIEIRDKFTALQAKADYELQTGETLPRSDVAAAIQRASSVLFRMMDQRSNVDLPPALEGMDAARMQTALVRSDAELKKAWSLELETLARNGEAKNGEVK